MIKAFEAGKRYYPEDRSYGPITVIRRTPKCIVVRNENGAIWRMIVKVDNYGNEYVTDSCVPSKWRFVFTYSADSEVLE